GRLREARSRPRPGPRGSALAEGQSVPDPLEGLLADPPDVEEILELLERAVLLAVLDDARGVSRPDAGQREQLLDARRVDVDLLSRGRRRRSGGGRRCRQGRGGEKQQCSHYLRALRHHGPSSWVVWCRFGAEK